MIPLIISLMIFMVFGGIVSAVIINSQKEKRKRLMLSFAPIPIKAGALDVASVAVVSDFVKTVAYLGHIRDFRRRLVRMTMRNGRGVALSRWWCQTNANQSLQGQ